MKIKTELKNIVKRQPDSLKAAVANEVLDHLDQEGTAECFFKDLMRGGCVSGMISSLIYYTDTTEFFNKHEIEITELVEETEFEMKLDSNYKNTLAWFGFEETAYNLANELGIKL